MKQNKEFPLFVYKCFPKHQRKLLGEFIFDKDQKTLYLIPFSFERKERNTWCRKSTDLVFIQPSPRKIVKLSEDEMYSYKRLYRRYKKGKYVL